MQKTSYDLTIADKKNEVAEAILDLTQAVYVLEDALLILAMRDSG